MTTNPTKRKAHYDLVNLLKLIFKAKQVWNNAKKIKKWDVPFIPYRATVFNDPDYKPLPKNVELSDNFIRHYFPIGEAELVTEEPVSIISSKYDPQRRKGIVRFKVINSHNKVSTKKLVSNLRESYGDATKKKWQGDAAGNTWMCGDTYYKNKLQIAPSFEKIIKVGDGLWEATFVPYELDTSVKYVPLTKTEQKYGVNILKHLLPEKNGWFGHKFNQGVGHVYKISNTSLKNNLIKTKLFKPVSELYDQNFNYNSRKYFKRTSRDWYGLELLKDNIRFT